MTTAVVSPKSPSVEETRDVPPATGDAADISCVVELALRAEGIVAKPEAIARSASRLRSDLGVGRHPFVGLSATAMEHGLNASPLRSTRDELIDHLDEGMTLVLATASGFLVVSAPTGGGDATVHRVAGGAATRMRRSIARALAPLGPDVLDVLVLEARYPLEALGPLGSGPDGAFRKLAAWARMERSELTTVVIYAVLIGILTLVVPVSAQAVVNTIAFGSVLQPLIILGVALSAGLLLSAALQGLRSYVVEVLQQRVFARVVNDFGRRIPRWGSDSAHGDPREIANRFFDVVTFQKSFAALAIDALGLILQIAIGLLLLAFYHPVLLALDVVLVVLLVALVWAPLRKGASTAIKESKAKYATAAWLQTLAEHRTTFADGRAGRAATTRAEALSRNYLDLRATHFRLLLRQIAGGLVLHVLASVALLVVGGWLVMQRQLTLGQLVAAELVVAVIAAGLAKLGKPMEKLYDAAAAIDKLSHVVDVPREREGGQRLGGTRPLRLDIEGMQHPRILGPVHARVAAGETLVVRGPEGSGKSSLLHCIFGDGSTDGAIRLDGVGLDQLDLAVYRDDVVFLDDRGRAPMMTLAELLRLHAPEATTETLRDALRRAGLEEAVSRLPDDLEQMLAPSGAPLSRKGMLRLGLARMLLRAPRLVLIDGTLDVFADDEALLSEVLGGPWTTVVVTEREAIEARGDRVLRLGEPPSPAALGTDLDAAMEGAG